MAAFQTSTGWFPVARAAEVGTTPVQVGAGGGAYVVVRLRPQGEVTAFPARCPHRLVPLAAGHVSEGRLVCPADRKSTRLNSSHANISYAVFCLKKKKITSTTHVT